MIKMNEIIINDIIELFNNIYIDDENKNIDEIYDELNELIEIFVDEFNDRFKIFNLTYELNVDDTIEL